MCKRPRSKNKSGTWRKKRSDASTEAISKSGSRAPQIHARLSKQGRRISDSVEITRTDRNMH
jgi:hypothetical protein